MLCVLIISSIIWPQISFSQQVLEVDEINFKHTDTKTFDEAQLKDATGLSKNNLFSRKLVEGDIQKLKKFYFDNGFFDAAVDTTIQINDEDEEASVTFIVTERKRYKIDSIQIGGIENVPQETLAKIQKIKTVSPGDFYNKTLLLQQQNEILDTLQNNGYMNARLKLDSGTIITRINPNAVVKLQINLEGTDSIYHFGTTEINIKDNVYGLRTEYPREEIVYREGEIYSKNRKLDSERNMAKIPSISSAKLNPISVTGDRVNFSADIILNKKNELTPFIKGANYENRFYLGAGIRYLNRYFLSQNQTLMLELEEDFHSTDINRTEFSATITKPHFIRRNMIFINRLSIGFNNVENYKNYFLANLTTLNYFIAPYTFYNNAYVDLNEELIWIKYDTIATGRQTQFNSFIGLTLEHDNTNNLLAPSRGFHHSILAGVAGLIPRIAIGILGKNVFYSQFFKTYTLNKFYFPLAEKDNMVFAANIKIGDIIEYGKGENLVPVQPVFKFFSGGSSSLRGWNAKENGILDNKQEGGTFLFEGSFEVRKKLFPSSEGFLKNLSAAFFIDYGNVWETHKDFRFSQIALAVGFGPRYDLFVGPIRIDLGFRLYDPSAPDGKKWLFDDFKNIFKEKFAFQFGIGQAF